MLPRTHDRGQLLSCLTLPCCSGRPKLMRARIKTRSQRMTWMLRTMTRKIHEAGCLGSLQEVAPLKKEQAGNGER